MIDEVAADGLRIGRVVWIWRRSQFSGRCFTDARRLMGAASRRALSRLHRCDDIDCQRRHFRRGHAPRAPFFASSLHYRRECHHFP